MIKSWYVIITLLVKKGFKYFIGYNNDEPLCIIILKMREYLKDFDESKYMSFTITDDLLLKLAIVLKKDLIVHQCKTKNISNVNKVLGR